MKAEFPQWQFGVNWGGGGGGGGVGRLRGNWLNRDWDLTEEGRGASCSFFQGCSSFCQVVLYVFILLTECRLAFKRKRRKARLIEQLGTIYISNISEGTAFLLQGVTKILCNTLKKEGRAFQNIGNIYSSQLFNQPCFSSFTILL